jgi:5-methylcytosine-specific restriction endonuclease McrA
MDAAVRALLSDDAVESRRGIYEYLLGRKTNPSLLTIRVFDARTKTQAYDRQTTMAEASGVSNCPLCAAGTNANKTRIYLPDEMDADHVTAWSKGGATDAANCEMLCVPHNRAKGNR